VKLFVKRNEKITIASGLALFSILVLSILSSPIFRMVAEAQDGNQTSSANAQEAQQKLSSLAQRTKELVASAGVNISLAQGDNLADQLRTLNESSQFKNLTQKLSQEISNLGLNGTNVRNLAQESDASLEGLVEKLQNLTSSRGT
jgi:phosphoribosylformylglycinamidine (FGAM) synthase-like enzyme